MHLARKVLGLTEQEFMSTTIGSTLVSVLSGTLGVALFVILPLAIHNKEKAEGSLVPNIPKWAGYTIRAMLSICVSLLVLICVAGFIRFLFMERWISQDEPP